MGRGFFRPLSVAGKRHDLIAVRLRDAREEDLPPVGFLEMEDPETGERLVVNTSDRAFLEAFSNAAQEKSAQLYRDFLRCNVDLIDIETGVPYVEPLMRFFQRRMRRFR